MANTYKAWKGAVEPAETGASGNELKLWKGAVEPAYVAPAGGGGAGGGGAGGRGLSATNLAEVNASHLHEVVLVKMEFDAPAYAHSGIGAISYAGDDYTGVGAFGGVSSTTETDELGPGGITLQLSGVDSTLLTEALDSGSYGDVVTLYVGYRQDDGTLVDDPWLLWRGIFEHATITSGESNVVSIILQHDLAILNETDGGRYTDEDQQSKFTSDVGLEFVADMNSLELLWGGGPVNTLDGGGNSGGPGHGDHIMPK